MPKMKKFKGRMRDLYCHWFKHRVVRERVWHDSVDYRATCRVCGRPLLRDVRGWRLFDTETDAGVDRNPHPRSRTRQRKLF